MKVKLHLYEIEGHGYYWEAYSGPYFGSGYLGTFDHPEALRQRFAGHLAFVYTQDAYDRVIEAAEAEGHPSPEEVPMIEGVPGVLCYVRDEAPKLTCQTCAAPIRWVVGPQASEWQAPDLTLPYRRVCHLNTGTSLVDERERERGNVWVGHKPRYPWKVGEVRAR